MGSIDYLLTDVLGLSESTIGMLTGAGNDTYTDLVRQMIGSGFQTLIASILGLDTASSDAFGSSPFDLLRSTDAA